jgi:hypothetical protein
MGACVVVHPLAPVHPQTSFTPKSTSIHLSISTTLFPIVSFPFVGSVFPIDDVCHVRVPLRLPGLYHCPALRRRRFILYLIPSFYPLSDTPLSAGYNIPSAIVQLVDYLTSTSPRIREIMTMCGLERLVHFLHDFYMPSSTRKPFPLQAISSQRPPSVPTLNPQSFDKHAA